MNTDSLKELTQRIIAYRDERDWKQFHSPKNLAVNMSVEAAELLDHYRWQDSPDDPAAVRSEAADVLYALLIFAHDTGIDLGEAMVEKLAHNVAKYPVDKAKGSPKKYTNLQ